MKKTALIFSALVALSFFSFGCSKDDSVTADGVGTQKDVGQEESKTDVAKGKNDTSIDMKGASKSSTE